MGESHGDTNQGEDEHEAADLKPGNDVIGEDYEWMKKNKAGSRAIDVNELKLNDTDGVIVQKARDQTRITMNGLDDSNRNFVDYKPDIQSQDSDDEYDDFDDDDNEDNEEQDEEEENGDDEYDDKRDDKLKVHRNEKQIKVKEKQHIISNVHHANENLSQLSTEKSILKNSRSLPLNRGVEQTKMIPPTSKFPQMKDLNVQPNISYQVVAQPLDKRGDVRSIEVIPLIKPLVDSHNRSIQQNRLPINTVIKNNTTYKEPSTVPNKPVSLGTVNRLIR